MDSSSPDQPQNVPLCVDLDGTLIHTDLFVESVLALAKHAPFALLKLPFWLLRGKAFAKRQIAARVTINPVSLPYNKNVIELIDHARQQGRCVELVTASDELLVGPIAQHLKLFDHVLCSDGEHNLRGVNKAKMLVDRHGLQKFDYVGNDRTDLPVWRACNHAIVVSASAQLPRLLKRLGKDSSSIATKASSWRTIIRAVRAHQWVKNLLIFAPLVMAHQLSNNVAIAASALAFVAFCGCASAVYLMNDLFDLESDREHRSKKRRPLASGELAVSEAFFIFVSLLLVAFIVSRGLSNNFRLCLGLYFVSTCAYSLRLKQIPLIDIFVLAGLYTLRILAGGYVAHIAVSPWLLAFSMFLFTSLACSKRYSELLSAKQASRDRPIGRGYHTSDLYLISQFGISSGYLAVLVMALYINSAAVRALYLYPNYLWLICPLLMYWISRIWLLTNRGRMHDDPIVFAIRDLTSYLVVILALIVMFGAAVPLH